MIVVKCDACGQKNRVTKPGARCGRCHVGLRGEVVGFTDRERPYRDSTAIEEMLKSVVDRATASRHHYGDGGDERPN